jgi:hypothetical protein
MANAGRKEGDKNPMNRTQHLDNPPLPIQAIDCPRPAVPTAEPESIDCFTKRTQNNPECQNTKRTQNRIATAACPSGKAIRYENTKQSQFEPIFDKICAIYPQGIVEILCLRYCGFEFKQNKPNYPHFQAKIKDCLKNKPKSNPKYGRIPMYTQAFCTAFYKTNLPEGHRVIAQRRRTKLQNKSKTKPILTYP